RREPPAGRTRPTGTEERRERMAFDPVQVFAHVLDTARRNLDTARRNRLATADPRQAARGALQPAQRPLGQSAFLACLDTMGGQEAALDRIERLLAPPAEQDAHGGVGG